jgi:hypothetical protein
MKTLPHKEAIALAQMCGRKLCSSLILSGGKNRNEWSSFELPNGELLDISFDGITGLTRCRVGSYKEFEALWNSEWEE